MSSPESRAPIGALVFDMDGVLIDSEPLWRRSEIEVFGTVGLTLSESDCFQTQGLRIDEAVDYWFARSPWSDRPREEVAQAIVERVAKLIRSEGEPLAGVQLAIDDARQAGRRLALASSSPAFLIDTVLETFGLTDAFEVRCSAEHEERGKPHPAVFLSAADALGLEAASCVAIEDSINGVISAVAARMRCIAIPPAETRGDPRFSLASARLDSLAELPHALREMEGPPRA